MRTSVTVPDDVAKEVQRVADALKESTTNVLRRAIRAGLPTVEQSVPARPEGYFAEALNSLPDEWVELENASAKWPQPEPEM